jgi:outer membrane protein assembly factor BamB
MLILFLAGSSLAGSAAADDNWPQFRGQQGAGVGTGSPPVRWDVATGENILWKTDIEGLSHASPIVWGDRVFLVTAVSTETAAPTLSTGWLGGTGESAADAGTWSWQLHAYDLTAGQLVWKREATVGVPLMKRHVKASHANCTPATDGQYVVAFFGSEGLYCYDTDGTLLWRTGFGRLHAGPYNAKEMEWGFASSPVIHGEHVIVQCDCLNTSFVAILRLADGVEVRRIPRTEVTTWSTPLVVDIAGQTQIVCNGYQEMASYDLNSGERLWFLQGGGDIPVPAPLFSHDLFLLTNGHGRRPTYAIASTARGDLTPSAVRLSAPKEPVAPPDTSASTETPVVSEPPVAPSLPPGLVWYEPRDGSYMPTPIVVGDYLYNCDDNGRLSVRNVTDGSLVYQERVGNGVTFSASAVATPSPIYYGDESGTVHVIRTGATFELLAENAMQDTIMATPAVIGDRLLIRTVKQLVCIGPKPLQ